MTALYWNKVVKADYHLTARSRFDVIVWRLSDEPQLKHSGRWPRATDYCQVFRCTHQYSMLLSHSCARKESGRRDKYTSWATRNNLMSCDLLTWPIFKVSQTDDEKWTTKLEIVCCYGDFRCSVTLAYGTGTCGRDAVGGRLVVSLIGHSPIYNSTTASLYYSE